MKTLTNLMAASAALVLMAAETGGGTGSGAANPKADADKSGDDRTGADASGASDPVIKSDPAPAPQTADEKAPAEPQPDPKPGAVGAAPKADPSPPASARDANTSGKRAYMIWVQAGHETLGIGQMIAVPTKDADVLRGAGRARFASDAEVKAAKDSKVAGIILTLDGV